LAENAFKRISATPKATFTDLRNLMRNLSTFSLAWLFYFTVDRCTKLIGPKVKCNKQAREKVEKFQIKFRRSVDVAVCAKNIFGKSKWRHFMGASVQKPFHPAWSAILSRIFSREKFSCKGPGRFSVPLSSRQNSGRRPCAWLYF